jgi:hypothetical protein
MYDNSPAFQSNDSRVDDDRRPGLPVPVKLVYVPPGADPDAVVAAALAESAPPPAEPAKLAPKPRSRRRARAVRNRRKRPEPRVRYKRASASPDDAEPLTDLARHEAKCSICNHPDREEIDEDFVHWLNPYRIAARYTLHDRSAVYRHARATGLYQLRRTHMQFILEHILEQVEDVDVTAHSIIRALRAYSRVSETGQWTEPPTRVIVSTAPTAVSQPSDLPPLLGAANLALTPAGIAKTDDSEVVRT